jgi:sulfur transfer complex TusBCD TusB component (DsrH family)
MLLVDDSICQKSAYFVVMCQNEVLSCVAENLKEAVEAISCEMMIDEEDVIELIADATNWDRRDMTKPFDRKVEVSSTEYFELVRITEY